MTLREQLTQWLSDGYTGHETPLDDYGREVVREVLALPAETPAPPRQTLECPCCGCEGVTANAAGEFVDGTPLECGCPGWVSVSEDDGAWINNGDKPCVQCEGETPAPETPRPQGDSDHWCVEVSSHGRSLVTIESRMLAGKPDLTPHEAGLIRTAGEHLLAFIGRPAPETPPADPTRRVCGERMTMRGTPAVFCDLIHDHLSSHEGPAGNDRWWFDESGCGILRTYHPTTNAPLAPNPERFTR